MWQEGSTVRDVCARCCSWYTQKERVGDAAGQPTNAFKNKAQDAKGHSSGAKKMARTLKLSDKRIERKTR